MATSHSVTGMQQSILEDRTPKPSFREALSLRTSRNVPMTLQTPQQSRFSCVAVTTVTAHAQAQAPGVHCCYQPHPLSRIVALGNSLPVQLEESRKQAAAIDCKVPILPPFNAVSNTAFLQSHSHGSKPAAGHRQARRLQAPVATHHVMCTSSTDAPLQAADSVAAASTAPTKSMRSAGMCTLAELAAASRQQICNDAVAEAMQEGESGNTAWERAPACWVAPAHAHVHVTSNMRSRPQMTADAAVQQVLPKAFSSGPAGMCPAPDRSCKHDLGTSNGSSASSSAVEGPAAQWTLCSASVSSWSPDGDDVVLPSRAWSLDARTHSDSMRSDSSKARITRTYAHSALQRWKNAGSLHYNV